MEHQFYNGINNDTQNKCKQLLNENLGNKINVREVTVCSYKQSCIQLSNSIEGKLILRTWFLEK